MTKFRIYALIHGQTLPLGKIAGCEIRQMDSSEQKRRGFSPIQYEFSENRDGYTSYATSLPFVDPMKLCSNYVVAFDIEEHDAQSALGGAVRAFDNLCSRLFLAGVRDYKFTIDRYIGETYLYQISKVYQLDENGNEQDAPLVLQSGHIFLPNRPDRNEWQDEETAKFLDKILDFKDPVFSKALKYLYSSSVGHYRLASFEKIALDHFKSIELIVNTLSKKDTFKQRVDEAAEFLELTADEIAEIKKYWDARSNGDIAHSHHRDPVAFYPNQFPLPTGGIGYPWAHLYRLSRVVLLKYYDVRRRYFHIDVHEPYGDDSSPPTLGAMNEHSECNHLFFETNTKHKKDVLKELKSEFCKSFQVDEKDLETEILGARNRRDLFIVGLFVKNPDFCAETNNIRNKCISIFG